jgi:hypothetical protein
MSAQTTRLPVASVDSIDESIRGRLRTLVAENSVTAVATWLGVPRATFVRYLDGHPRLGSILVIQSQARILLGRGR